MSTVARRLNCFKSCVIYELRGSSVSYIKEISEIYVIILI